MSIKRGLIVIGYQGIGKTTLVNHHSKSLRVDGVIDLDSSVFKANNGQRPENWHVIYCDIAISLAKLGYIVMISSHKQVRQALAKKYNPNNDTYSIVIICPHISLEHQWIAKLRNRYGIDHSESNFIAWKNATEQFSASINELSAQSDFSTVFIERMDYDLECIIFSYQRLIRGLNIPDRVEGC